MARFVKRGCRDIQFKFAEPRSERRLSVWREVLIGETQHAVLTKSPQNRAEVAGGQWLVQIGVLNPRAQ
jgi:hypothetical protein